MHTGVGSSPGVEGLLPGLTTSGYSHSFQMGCQVVRFGWRGIGCSRSHGLGRLVKTEKYVAGLGEWLVRPVGCWTGRSGIEAGSVA